MKNLILSLCLGLNHVVYAQTTFQYVLDSSVLHFSPLPTPMAGKYLPTDYSKISKPLVVEHFKSNCQTYKVASSKHASAGNVANVLFGGDQPAGWGNPSDVFTTQTFSKKDFPICLETNVYAESNIPEYNEAYFWIGPANYVHFGSPTYHLNSEHYQKEGVIVGGRPFEMYVDNCMSATQATSAVFQKTHNYSGNKAWYNFRVIYDYSGNDLVVKGAYINGKAVLATDLVISNTPFLSNFRLALCTDDLVQGFKIVLNYGTFSSEVVVSDTVVCEGDTLFYTSQNNADPTAGVTYQWSFGGGTPSASNVKMPGNVVYPSPGYYQTRLISTNGNLKDTSDVWVLVQPRPQVVLPRDTTICAKTFYIQTINPFDDYLWMDGLKTRGRLVDKSGVYSIRVTTGSCQLLDTVEIRLEDIEFTLGNDTAICLADQYILSISTFADTYLWSTGSIESQIVVDQKGTYWARVTKGKCIFADTVIISSTEQLLIDAGDDQLRCFGDTAIILLTLPNDIKAKWSNGFVGNSIYITKPGTYVASIKACETLYDTVKVDFEDCCHIWIPNAFTANYDGLNEVFRVWMSNPGCAHIRDFELRIYDLWGGLIYMSTDKNAGWNGEVQGQTAPLGAYVWTASWHDGFENKRQSGTVTLLR